MEIPPTPSEPAWFVIYLKKIVSCYPSGWQGCLFSIKPNQFPRAFSLNNNVGSNVFTKQC